MITLNMVHSGYATGIIKLMESPLEDGVVCAIGDNWFYFGGLTAEEMSVAEYEREIPTEDIMDNIFQVLENFRKEGKVFEEEYLYYETYLNEQLKKATTLSAKDMALQIFQENPELAREVYYLVDSMYKREDLVAKIKEEDGIRLEDFSDEEINKITARFHHTLSNNVSYWESYWASAEAVIDEVAKEKNKPADHKGLPIVAKAFSDGIVNTALKTIEDFGCNFGSGYYVLNSFKVDGKDLNLLIDVCQFKDDINNTAYYGVYYIVEFDGGDNLLSDWKYTSCLSSFELKDLVFKIANTDFTEDIKKYLGKGSVEAMLSDAEMRSQDGELSSVVKEVLELG